MNDRSLGTYMNDRSSVYVPNERWGFDAAVLAVYGTTRAAACTAAIEPVRRAVERATGLPCDLAFSGPAVCRILEERGEDAPGLERILQRVAAGGARRVAVVSGMVVDGWAQENLRERARATAGRLGLDGIAVTAPLLRDSADVDVLANALADMWPPEPSCMTLFAGHGIGGPADSGYARAPGAFDPYAALAAAFMRAGRDDMAVACLSDGAQAAVDAVRGVVRASGDAKVRLVPLMLTAGRHVLKNMGGADERSWASTLRRAGYAPQVFDRGLGELAVVQQMFARRARALFD